MLAAIIVIIILIALIIIWTTRKSMLLYAYDIRGNKYYVRAELQDANKAALRMHLVKKDIMKFLRYVRDKYRVDYVEHTGIRNHPEVYPIVDAILDGFDAENVYENSPYQTLGGTSYTVGKGQKTFWCLRNIGKRGSSFVDHNTLVFVALHELSHIGNTREWGHGKRFWTVFKFVLTEAVQAGIYRPVDYARNPVKFCGLVVNYQPLYDTTLPNL